jgi:TrmH family RNA methyltransferase
MTIGEPAITSLTNSRVKAAVRLRDRRAREASGNTIIDGGRELLRALDAGVAVIEAFVEPGLIRDPDTRAALERLEAIGAPMFEVSPTVLAKVAFGDRSDGIVAIVRTPVLELGDLDVGLEPLVVVVEGVEKPGNLGAILRSADGAGADAVIAADPRTDPYNPNAIRASLGTIFSLPVAAGSTAEVLSWLEGRAIRAVAAHLGASKSYAEADLRGPLAIVLGSEASGLTEAWDRNSVERIRIPMLGAADSLNVSVAAAVLLFEARRQRAADPGGA